MKIIRLLYVLSLATLLLPLTTEAAPWSWDMHTQPSHKAQEEAAVPMPKGTVPTKGIHAYELTTKKESAKIPNPIPPTEKSIARGESLFKIYCVVCHGSKGHGDGKVGKKYMSPTDLTSDYIKKIPDGFLYFTITKGGVGKDDEMPSQGDAMSPEDRWHLVNYIKNVITWW